MEQVLIRARDPLGFSFDPQCVLNLPLYQLDGEQFMDKSHYGHLCTRVGGIMTPQGWKTDGGDIINAGTNFTITDKLTLAAWVNVVNMGGAPRIIGADNRWILFLMDGHRLSWYGSGVNAQFSVFDATGRWVFVTAIYDGDGIDGYVDCVYQGTLAKTGNLDTLGSTPVTLGNRVAMDRGLTGITGRGFILNRDWTLLEMQNYYLQTKWRYQ